MSPARRAQNALTSSRYICEIFRELPDRTVFPDYFEAIPEPECLDEIAVRCTPTSKSELIIEQAGRT